MIIVNKNIENLCCSGFNLSFNFNDLQTNISHGIVLNIKEQE